MQELKTNIAWMPRGKRGALCICRAEEMCGNIHFSCAVQSDSAYVCYGGVPKKFLKNGKTDEENDARTIFFAIPFTPDRAPCWNCAKCNRRRSQRIEKFVSMKSIIKRCIVILVLISFFRFFIIPTVPNTHLPTELVRKRRLPTGRVKW